MPFVAKLALVCVSGAIVDVFWAVHIRALVASEMALAVSSVLAINFLAFFGQFWFVECPGFWRRLAITGATALGAGIGTAVVLWLDL